MANSTGSMAEVKKALSTLSIKNTVSAARHYQGISMRSLDKRMGLKAGTIARRIANNDVGIHLLIALSTQLKMNLLEPYLIMMPEELQATGRERQLQKQITTLQQQLNDLTKERDLLKEIAMK